MLNIKIGEYDSTDDSHECELQTDNGYTTFAALPSVLLVHLSKELEDVDPDDIVGSEIQLP